MTPVTELFYKVFREVVGFGDVHPGRNPGAALTAYCLSPRIRVVREHARPNKSDEWH